MAIALVVLCLTMAAAGALGLNQARRDRRLTLEDMERLRGRVEEYRELAASLEGAESYDALSGRLDERQQAYDRESAQHRSELGTFTATQYGVGVGLDAIDEAEAQFLSYKQQFDSALSVLDEGLTEIDGILASLWTLYNVVPPILNSARGHVDAAQGIAASLDSGDALRYSQLVAAYDELLGIADESAETAETLRGLEPTLDALAEVDLSALSDKLSAAQQLSESLGAFGDVPLDAYLDYGVEIDFDMGRIVQLQESYRQVWAAAKQGLALYDEASAQAEGELEALTGMDSKELRKAAKAQRDELAAYGDEPLDPAASTALLRVWRSNREAVLEELDAADAGLQELSGYVEQLHGMLSTIQTQIDGFWELLTRARDMIAAAWDALVAGRQQIWLQMGLQREKEEELWDRKDALDREALELQQLSEEAEAQKDREARLRTLRTNLLARDGIRARFDAGEELGGAAQTFLDETLDAAGESYARRRVACLLMIFGAAYSVLGIPAAFERAKSRLMLSLPLLHCMACAACAEQILWKLGRGLSYSCIAVLGFALLQLLVSRPKKRKRKRA